MPYSRKERGSKHPYRMRYGMQNKSCLGIFKQPEPGAIPDEALRDAINARLLDSGALSERGGQQRAINSGLNGCIFGMIDVPTPELMYLGTESVIDTFLYLGSTGSGTYARLFDGGSPPPELSDNGRTSVQPVVSGRRNMFVFNGKPHIVGAANFVTNVTNIYELIKEDDGITPTKFSKKLVLTLTEEPSNYAVLPDQILSDGSLGELLFIAMFESGNVYSWDGKTLKLELSTGASTRLMVGAGLDDIFVFWLGNGRRRLGGLWTPITGVPGTFNPTCMTTYQGRLVAGSEGATAGLIFIGDVSNSVLSTHVPSAIVGFDAASLVRICDLEVFDGVLCYLWDSFILGPAGDPCFIGVFEGTGFVDDMVVFTAGVSSSRGHALLNGDRTLFATIDWGGNFVVSAEANLFGITDVFTPHNAGLSEVLVNIENATGGDTPPTMVAP